MLRRLTVCSVLCAMGAAVLPAQEFEFLPGIRLNSFYGYELSGNLRMPYERVMFSPGITVNHSSYSIDFTIASINKSHMPFGYHGVFIRPKWRHAFSEHGFENHRFSRENTFMLEVGSISATDVFIPMQVYFGYAKNSYCHANQAYFGIGTGF